MSKQRPALDGHTSPWLAYLVKRVELAERASLESVLRPWGVTLHQYTALSILERGSELSSAQLARRHFVTPQAMNQLVTALERDGLIGRTPDPANRRVLRARLTDRGRQILTECNQAVNAVEQRMLAGMTTAEVAKLRKILERFLDVLASSNGRRPGATP